MAETKQEVKHTALPWHQGGTSPEELMSPNTIFAADGAAVAQFYGISLHNTLKEVDKKRCAEGLGNIATVLEAVNSHALLVEALEAAQEELRLLRMKDTNVVYNPGLNGKITLALQAAKQR